MRCKVRGAEEEEVCVEEVWMLDIKKKRRGKKMGQRQRFGGIIYLSKKHAYPRNVHQ